MLLTNVTCYRKVISILSRVLPIELEDNSIQQHALEKESENHFIRAIRRFALKGHCHGHFGQSAQIFEKNLD